MKFLDNYRDQAYALLRITSAFIFIFHGTQKLFGFPPSPFGESPWHIQYVAGGIELVGGVLIMIGLFTRPAAFLASGLMAAAYWMAHFSTEKYLPIMNGGDASVLFCFVFLFIATKGAGIWSVEGRS